jgi:flavin reductase (DIM6/NTAB) family NADH-FMN oxidoreductase RutF
MINLLAEGQSWLARQFALSASDKFAGVRWARGERHGDPRLGDTIAWLDCDIVATHPGGDHEIVVCQVVDLDGHPSGRPLIFYKSGFERINS